MKIHCYLKRQKAGSLIALLMLALMASCKKNDNNGAKALEANHLESAEVFASALKERKSDNTFVIEDIIRKDAFLQVKVKGGGSEESFKFIWDGYILLTYPSQINLILKYNNENNDFDKDKEFLLTVNLQKILGNKHDIKNFNFSIINGSMIQQKSLDPNGNVSDEQK
jgi:hypothetical protein